MKAGNLHSAAVPYVYMRRSLYTEQPNAASSCSLAEKHLHPTVAMILAQQTFSIGQICLRVRGLLRLLEINVPKICSKPPFPMRSFGLMIRALML